MLCQPATAVKSGIVNRYVVVPVRPAAVDVMSQRRDGEACPNDSVIRLLNAVGSDPLADARGYDDPPALVTVGAPGSAGIVRLSVAGPRV